MAAERTTVPASAGTVREKHPEKYSNIISLYAESLRNVCLRHLKRTTTVN